VGVALFAAAHAVNVDIALTSTDRAADRTEIRAWESDNSSICNVLYV
jgi:hypothetical protein